MKFIITKKEAKKIFDLDYVSPFYYKESVEIELIPVDEPSIDSPNGMTLKEALDLKESKERMFENGYKVGYHDGYVSHQKKIDCCSHNCCPLCRPQ